MRVSRADAILSLGKVTFISREKGDLTQVPFLEATAFDSQDALEQIRAHWIAHIVHDFRGPLFAARGYSKLLLEGRSGELNADQRRYLETILDNVNKLAACVSAMQPFPSAEHLRLEPIDLTELFSAAISELNVPHETLRALTSQGSWMTMADRAKLTLAVHKLLGGMVEISQSPSKLGLDGRREDDECSIRMFTELKPSTSDNDPVSLPDITIPSEILRLHGGVVSAACNSAGIYNVIMRLPLISPGTGNKGK